MENTLPSRVRLGVFEVDLRAGELREGESVIRLQEQPFQILVMLLERDGAVVTRDEIQKKLWPNDTLVEFDHSINTAMKKLRGALGDSADNPKYIETVARRGYRLRLPVEWPAAPDNSTSAVLLSSPSDEGTGTALQPEAAVLIGRTVSHYRVLEIIGGGGMGVVYRAEDLKLGREVALKFLPEELGSEPEAMARFSREARAASSLDHVNICSIHEFGEHEGRPFIVMPLLKGETLRDRLAMLAATKAAFSLEEMLDVAIQITDGLQAAHEKGIVHRDIKPANIMITRKGGVKILDFGLAKLLEGSSEEAIATHSMEVAAPVSVVSGGLHLTRTGSAMGTAGYMSPEQVRGEKLDARSDIFSFGLVLYEMATGQRAFSDNTAPMLHAAIVNNSPIAVRELNSTLPAKLVATIDKCLSKQREQRCQSAAEVRRDLEAVRMAGQGKRARRYQLIGAAVLMLALLIIGWYVRRSPARPPTPTPALEVKLLTEHGNAVRAAATRDGRYVAYVKHEAGNYEVRLLQVATERDVQLLPGSPLEIRSLHFSPDGDFIYFLRVLDPAKDLNTAGVFRIATLGGAITPLAADAHATDQRAGSVTVSPDGKQIAYIAQTAEESLIVSIDPNGANRLVLARRPLAHSFWFLEWSPSQNTLAAVADTKDSMELVKIELPARSITDLNVSGWGALGQPAWSPDGVTVYAPAIALTSHTPIMQIWAIDARSGACKPLTSSSTRFLQWSLSATATGDLIANTTAPETTLWTMNRSGELRTVPTLRGEGVDGAVWVGERIVTSNITEMVVHDATGGNPTKLRSYSSIYRNLEPCGPGSVAYWARDDKHKSHIARTDITTGLASALTQGPRDFDPGCSADGSTLVFNQCTRQGNHCSLVRKSLDSGQSVVLYEYDPTKENVGLPTLSFDGNIRFRRQRDGEDPYEWGAAVPINGGEIKKLRMPIPFSQVGVLAWTRDGKSIFYTHAEKGAANVWSASLDGKSPRKLTHFDSERIFSIGVSADGRLVFARGHRANDVVLIKNAKE